MRYPEPIATILEVRITMVFDDADIASVVKPTLVPGIRDLQKERLAAVELPGCFEESDFYMGE